MTAQRSDLENQVRDLVARVLLGVLDGPASSDDSPAPSHSHHDEGADRIAIGSDHGGFELKQSLLAQLIDAGWDVEDCGTHSTAACDYPTFAHAVARRVATGKCGSGIMVDGAGIGSAMVANKIPRARQQPATTCRPHVTAESTIAPTCSRSAPA